jgi:hypothetical protein
VGRNKELDHRRARLLQWMDARDGIVTGAELAALGFSKDDVAGLVDRGELVVMRRGLFRGRGARWDLRAELRAALSEQGEGARLVLISALHWQGLLLRPATKPEVGVPGNEGVRKLRHRTVYRTPYARPEPLMHLGLPCSAPVDALPQLAGRIRGDHAARRAFRRALRESVRRDVGLIARLRDQVDRDPVKGAPEIRATLALLPGATVVRSDLEEDFIAFCEIWGLPRFVTNQKVGGVERDAVRVDERVIVELDTRGYHGNLIAMESDRARRRHATVAGWRHLEITGRDFRDEPGRVAADLASLLGLSNWVPPAEATSRWAAVLRSARGIWLPRR